MRRDPRRPRDEGGNFAAVGPPDPLRQILAAALRADEQLDHYRGMAESYGAEVRRLTHDREELVARLLEAESRIVRVANHIAAGAIDDSDILDLQRLRSYADTLERSYFAHLAGEGKHRSEGAERA